MVTLNTGNLTGTTLHWVLCSRFMLVLCFDFGLVCGKHLIRDHPPPDVVIGPFRGNTAQASQGLPVLSAAWGNDNWYGARVNSNALNLVFYPFPNDKTEFIGKLIIILLFVKCHKISMFIISYYISIRTPARSHLCETHSKNRDSISNANRI